MRSAGHAWKEGASTWLRRGNLGRPFGAYADPLATALQGCCVLSIRAKWQGRRFRNSHASRDSGPRNGCADRAQWPGGLPDRHRLLTKLVLAYPSDAAHLVFDAS